MVRRLKRGRPPHPDVLTPGEWRIVDAVRHGLSNRTIARLRGISVDAVKYHVGNAVAKLGLASRRDLQHWRGAPAIGAFRGAVDGALQTEEPQMGDDLELGPIGQISREVNDVDEAVKWFRDVLKLPLLGHYGTLATFDMGGVRLLVTRHEQRSGTGNSIMYFNVADIDAAYAALTARGIAFRGAPHRIVRHPDGTEEWMAFFEDMDGGLLALMSRVGP